MGSVLTFKPPPALAPLLLSLLAGGLALRAHRAASAQDENAPGREPPCAADVVALLGGLRDGDALAGFTVQRISCREPRAATIELQGAPGSLSVLVAARGALPHAPPARTERCELFYSNRGSPPTQEATQSALEATALRVRGGEKKGLPAGW